MPPQPDQGDESGQSRSDEDYIEEWRELLRASVRLRLMSDVPLGMFLSGGIDSSAIAALMSEMVGEPIKTFSVAFEEREANELDYAREASAGFRHRPPRDRRHPGPVPRGAAAARLARGRAARASRRAWPSTSSRGWPREHVMVVLTGEGSDETACRLLPLPQDDREPCRGRLVSQAVHRGDAQRGARAARCSRPAQAPEQGPDERSSSTPRTSSTSTSTTSPSFRAPCNRCSSRTRRSSGSACRDPYAEMSGLLRGPSRRDACSIGCCTRTSRRTCTNC